MPIANLFVSESKYLNLAHHFQQVYYEVSGIETTL